LSTAGLGSRWRFRGSAACAAREQWDLLQEAGAKLHTSVPVVIETFTFLDRNANRDVALTWKESIYEPGTSRIFLRASRHGALLGIFSAH